MFNKAGALFLFAVLSIGVFRWTAANGDAIDDQKLVQELDSRYQSAVEKNDAATMDRLLADFSFGDWDGQKIYQGGFVECRAQWSNKV